jgi:hypothetical protein
MKHIEVYKTTFRRLRVDHQEYLIKMLVNIIGIDRAIIRSVLYHRDFNPEIEYCIEITHLKILDLELFAKIISEIDKNNKLRNLIT